MTTAHEQQILLALLVVAGVSYAIHQRRELTYRMFVGIWLLVTFCLITLLRLFRP